MSSKVNPFSNLLTTLEVDGKTYSYYDLTKLDQEKYRKLPFSIRILLESAIRACDGFQVNEKDVDTILNWETNQSENIEIPFNPSRVILQDLTGVPACVDFAAMRDAFKRLGGDPEKINPLVPTDLVIDHSVQVDYSRTILNKMRPGNGNNTHGQSSPATKAPQFCDDCQKSGKCMLANNLIERSVPVRATNGHAKSVINDIENWIPHSFDKLRQDSCPFHRQKSLGADSLHRNQDIEFQRNKERFTFLKWASTVFRNFTTVPPGSGICHQVNLEYLARVVFQNNGLLFPDSLVGADSHTTMINGLGIVGWGVGGIEAEAVMLGQSISMVLPQVIGYKLIGQLPTLATSTDLVLTITKHLRSVGVVGKFVEFFGPGVHELSIADRATIANMCPEYGATIGFFPVDDKAIAYLEQTGRKEESINYISAYLKAVNLYRNYSDASQDPVFTKVYELDLTTITPSASGPKRPQDRVAISDMKNDFLSCLSNKVGFKGFGIPTDKLDDKSPFLFDGQEYVLSHGSVVIAAITSCTNTSNPSVMLGAGLLAKKAVEKGLTVAPYIKTSMSPGSGVVTYYLKESGVAQYLEKLGFDIVGYGCMTCIGNSGPLPEPVVEAIDRKNLVVSSVLSGNRNFEGRVHPNTRANYLASPLLVVAYALAGSLVIDFETEPLGKDQDGNDVFLRDIWPSREEIQTVEQQYVIPALFKEVYSKVTHGNERWNSLEVNRSIFYPWDSNSTYIKYPPFFDGMTVELPPQKPIRNARALLYLGDSVTTDHISPAGSIARNSAAGKFLMEKGVEPKDFNSYGARRGNDAIMVRGTFANIRLVNKLVTKPGPKTVYIPTNEELFVYDAAERYVQEGVPLIVVAGRDYGCGSSRDWAAKGPLLQGVRAVIAESYERIHRSNLIGMGIMPLQFIEGQSGPSLGLTGHEIFDIEIPDQLTTRQKTRVLVQGNDQVKEFEVLIRFDTEVELRYYLNGGILQFMLRRMLKQS